MLKTENIRVFNFEGALRGLRNPKDSWRLSDSVYGIGMNDAEEEVEVAAAWRNMHPDAEKDFLAWLGENGVFNKNHNGYEYAFIGPKDMRLAQMMIGAGTDEAKFMRQIFISMDITAPLYWWKEYDTYKVATVANSCSTMHKLDAYPITREMFSWDNDMEDEEFWHTVDVIIAECERLRQLFKETKDKRYWRALVQLLPNSWMQKRTVTLNYQTARAMYFARRYHKLTEWHTLCNTFMELPYGEDLIGYTK